MYRNARAPPGGGGALDKVKYGVAPPRGSTILAEKVPLLSTSFLFISQYLLLKKDTPFKYLL